MKFWAVIAFVAGKFLVLEVSAEPVIAGQQSETPADRLSSSFPNYFSSLVTSQKRRHIPWATTEDDNNESKLILDRNAEKEMEVMATAMGENRVTSRIVSDVIQSGRYRRAPQIPSSAGIPTPASGIPSGTEEMLKLPGKMPSLPTGIPLPSKGLPTLPTGMPKLPGTIPTLPSGILPPGKMPTLPSGLPSVAQGLPKPSGKILTSPSGVLLPGTIPTPPTGILSGAKEIPKTLG